MYFYNSLIINILFVIGTIVGTTTDEQKTNLVDSKQRGLGRQSFGTNLVDPYYAFNPDYMGGNMPSLQSYQSSVPDLTRPSTCRCSCADISYAPQISCLHPQQCVMACLQMYGGQCTIINTYGCCGSSCQYFQSQSLTNRYCTCNCAGQQYYNPIDTCSSAQSCLTRCTDSFSQVCQPTTTQACCGSDCMSYSQAIATSCACTCRGNIYYPSPQCLSSEACLATCMTTYGDCTYDQTQGCCGANCGTYIPTCACSCGSDFQVMTSVPCLGSQSCLDTCISSYGACTPDNTQACCGNDCRNTFSSCTCMCGSTAYQVLPMACGSSQQCVQACLQTVSQCSLMNTYACCGSDCASFIPTCRCQCGRSVYYSTTNCMTAEQCTNACISQYGHICTPTNTLGCCNGTFCTNRNRFVGVSHAFKDPLPNILIFFVCSIDLIFFIFFF